MDRELVSVSGLALALIAVVAWGGADLMASPAPSTGTPMLSVVVPVRGGSPGNAADSDDTTYSFAADNSVTQLVRTDGSPIGQGEVPAIYGLDDGMTIYDDGVDVASLSYSGWGGPLTPLGMDLSDGAGWPNIAVASGRVGIDPTIGRFKFRQPGPLGLLGSDGTHAVAYDGVAVQGEYAYVTDFGVGRGLDVIDVSDPANPTWKATRTVWGNGMDVVVDGDYAYTTMKSKGLCIYYVDNPTNPILVGSITANPPQPDAALHLFKAGNYVYVADEYYGVVIYNVTVPSNPFFVGVCPIAFAESVWVEGDYAYVTGGQSGLHIYDVSSPATPQWRGSLATMGYSYDVQVVGQYAYVTEGSGIRVVNVSDPAHPSHVTLVGTPAQAYDIRISGRYAFVAERGTPGYVEVYDLCNPGLPVFVTRYATASGSSGLCPYGDLVYAAGGDLGLLVIDPKLSEAPCGPVTVDYNWSDSSETPTPTLEPTPTATPDPSSTMTLTLQVAFQGRGTPPSARWEVPLHVTMTEPLDGPVRQSYVLTSSVDGEVTVADVPQGVYDVRVCGSTSLINVCRARSLGAGSHTLEMSVLIEGDAKQDGIINILDFSLLASSYGTSQGSPGYDSRSDFNGDGIINILDFSLLASNYTLTGPRDVTGG